MNNTFNKTLTNITLKNSFLTNEFHDLQAFAGDFWQIRRTWPADLIFNGVTVAHEQPQAPAELTPPAQLPWLRRLAARLLGRGLSRRPAQHIP
jgi:hypothetical protein